MISVYVHIWGHMICYFKFNLTVSLTSGNDKYRIDHVTVEDMRLYPPQMPEAQPSDKTVSKEDILGAYPPL